MTVRTIDEIFRDFVTDGVPASGPFNPHKPDIRDTLKALTEGSGNFPDNRVIRLNNADAGTANNIVVTASVAIPVAAYQVLYILNVTQENTGPVTVYGAINRSLVTNINRPVPAGYLTPGMALLCIDNGTELRLLSYGDAEAIQAAAEAAADRAEDAAAAAEAAAGGLLSSFGSRAEVELTNIPALVTYLRTAGYYSAGDGGGALYKRVVSEPTHAGKIQSADGAWWEIAENSFNIMMFGARKGNVNTYASANLSAVQGALDTANTIGVRDVVVPTGTFVVSAAINIPKTYNVNLRGFGRNSILKGGNSFSGQIITYGDNVNGAGILAAIENIGLGGALSGTAHGIQCLKANTGQITGVYFSGVVNCIMMSESYAVKITKCDFLVPSGYCVYSSTGCHNLLIDTCWGWTSGAAFLRVEGVTNNIVVTNSDIEYCTSVIQTTASVRSLIFMGNYVEGTVNREFSFGDSCIGFTCDNNVIELRGAVPGSGIGSGVASSYSNIKGGTFRFNSMYEQKISFDNTCEGMTVVAGPIVANPGGNGASLTMPLYRIPTLQNNWTQTDGTTYPVGFIRDGDGVLHIKGQITSGSGSSGSVAFTLPAGYRPQTRQVIPCMATNGAAQLIVDTNGNVAPTLVSGQSVWLDNVRIPVIGTLA
ncbi:hypothetical protein [Brucella anthropi]|uniref:hypothetical protein n=1 Tax=Brucella anthropi TaxID=529 RepID=UPI000AB515CE|nr:hypothetical protein [Ochrobactrum sp. UNC390CL2Tsu3S39]